MSRVARALSLLALLPFASCTSEHRGGGTGQVTVRVEAATVTVTRVSLEVQPGDVRVDLARDGGTQTFVGAVTVPAGAQTFTAVAWDGTQEVGRGTAGATVVENRTTQVFIRIVGEDPPPGPDHAPIVTSLVVPAAVVAGETAAFSVTAVEPDGDALSFAWADGCGGTFLAPDAAQTGWTRAAPATCAITATASSRHADDLPELSDAESASVEVLLTPPGTGRVDVTGAWIPCPLVQRVTVGEATRPLCAVGRTDPDATCRAAAAQGVALPVEVAYDLGTSAPGAYAPSLQASCGAVAASGHDAGSARFVWTPPTAGAVCLLTGAVAHEGLADELVIAIAVACPDDDAEPNDAAAAAAPLGAAAPGSTLSRAGLLANDQDWFAFTASAAGAATVSATGADALRVEVYDGALVLVAAGTGSASASLGAGTYVVHVPPGPSAASCGAAPYALAVAMP